MDREFTKLKRALIKAFSLSWLLIGAFVALAKLAEYIQEGSAGITFIEVCAFIGMGLGLSTIATLAIVLHYAASSKSNTTAPQKPA